MKKILLSTLLLFGVHTFALEPTDGIKIDGKEYKNIESMAQIIKNNWKDFSQKDYPKLNEKTTTLSKNIDISLSNKNTEIGKYINYSTSLSTLDRLAELQAQITQKNKALEDAKKARDEKLLSLSLKAIYLVRISNVGSRENVKALASKAESAITPQAVEKLNGTFIESLTIGNGSKFKEQITVNITGSMRVEKELINEYFRQSGQYVYLAKVAVSPLQGAKSGGKSSGVSDKDIFVEYIEASVGKKETLPSKTLESIELVISQYKQSVESENELTLQNQQQIMGEYARVVKKTTAEISSLEDEIEETKTQLTQLYKNIGYTAKNQTVSEAKKYLASKIAELESQRIEIKNSELFLKKSTQTTESEDIDKEIAMMASSLVTNLIQTYEKIDNFSATTVLNNGEVVAQNKNQNKTTFRKIDTFWVYPAPTDGNGFDVAVVAKFKINSTKALPKLICLNDNCVFENEMGELAIPAKYKMATWFAENGLASVSLNGNKWGFINTKGEMVIPAKYDQAFWFAENGLAPVNPNGKFGFINTKGEMVIPAKYEVAFPFVKNDLTPVSLNGAEFGFINTKGEMVIPVQYSQATPFVEHDLASVKLNEKWGFINTKGEMVIPAKYDEAFWFAENGLASVKLNGKWGFINTKGEMVIPAKYDEAFWFAENGLAVVKVNGKFGFINTKGEMVIPAKYDLKEPLYLIIKNGLTWVKLNGKEMLIDEKGNEYNSPVYNALKNGTIDTLIANFKPQE